MRRNEGTKKLVINALLLGIGAMLHQLTPALGLPMQPDFALAMLFIIMILNNGDYKTSLIAGVITGTFTAMTTKFPGGQIPNMIDKIITVHIVFILMYGIKAIFKEMDTVKRNIIICMTILPIGTLVSGVAFLGSASIIAGLPAPFMALFTTVVIPAVLINLVAGIALYKIVLVSMKRASLA